MRFPLKYERYGDGYYCATVSAALWECLNDQVFRADTKTGKFPEDSFEFPIEEGPLLSLLQDYFVLFPTLHVGCSADHYRPPSINFLGKNQPSLGIDGEFSFGYSREIKSEVFQQEGCIRNHAGQRDLQRVSSLLNDPTICEEATYFSWCDDRRAVSLSLSFENRCFLEFGGLHHTLPRQSYTDEADKVMSAISPDSLIREVARIPWVREFHTRRGNLPKEYEDLTAAHLVYAFLELASRVVPTVSPLDRGRIMTLQNDYRL